MFVRMLALGEYVGVKKIHLGDWSLRSHRSLVVSVHPQGGLRLWFHQDGFVFPFSSSGMIVEVSVTVSLGRFHLSILIQ